jgi:hypothetical protein
MAVSNVTVTGVQHDILASTLRILRDKEVDNTFKSIPLLEAVQRHGNVQKISGGSYIDAPVILTDHSSITNLKSGYEAISLAVKDPLRTANWKWTDFVAPVVLTDTESLSNKGERALVNILSARLKSVLGMMRREWEKQVVANSSTILDNLESLYYNGTDGWFDAKAFGGQDNTVGNIDKTSFQSSWQNQVSVNTTYDVSSNRISEALADVCIQSQIYAPDGQIDIILMSPTGYKRYKQELTAQERYTSVSAEKDMAGKLVLMFNGAACYVEPFMVSGGASGLLAYDSDTGAAISPTAYIHAYLLNSKMFDAYFDSDAFFALGDMQKISGYAASSANILCRTQLTTQHLASHGIVTFTTQAL